MKIIDLGYDIEGHCQPVGLRLAILATAGLLVYVITVACCSVHSARAFPCRSKRFSMADIPVGPKLVYSREVSRRPYAE